MSTQIQRTRGRYLSGHGSAPCPMLKSDGFLSYKTDHAGYFAATRAILDELQIFYIEALENDLHNSPLAEATPPTEFESLFRSKGLPVMYLHAKKIGRLEKPRV